MWSGSKGNTEELLKVELLHLVACVSDFLGCNLEKTKSSTEGQRQPGECCRRGRPRLVDQTANKGQCSSQSRFVDVVHNPRTRQGSGPKGRAKGSYVHPK